jgi:hypothetical protein
MKNIKLAEIHKAFIQGIYGQADLAADAFIASREGMSAEQCLAVYQGSVFGNLSSALMDIYPATLQCLGEQFFQAMALRYLKQNPSTSASLDDYGQSLAEFSESFEPLANYPYIPDLLRLEWCWHRAFHASDESPLDFSILAEIPYEDSEHMMFTLAASIHLLSSDYPVADIWRHCLQDKSTGNNDEALDLAQGGQSIMVWRAANYELRVDVLTSLEFDLLQRIKKSQTLGTILADLQSKYLSEDINQALAQAAQKKCFVGYELA